MGDEATTPDFGDEEGVPELVDGLPGVDDDLIPLSQVLISPELFSAFNIKPEPCRTIHDVDRASQTTVLNLRTQTPALSRNNFEPFNREKNATVDLVDDDDNENDQEETRSESKKIRRIDLTEEADPPFPGGENSNSVDDQSGNKALKRPRLVWTPQLHKRFVDVVGHLGIKNAVPKTIMQLMNVEGLTRENVASHLQKYRLYSKRMQGLPSEGPSSADPLFATTPVPQNLQENRNGRGSQETGGHAPPLPIPVPFVSSPGMMAMPAMGMGHHGHMAMAMGGHNGHYHPYAAMWNWPRHPHAAPTDK